MKKTLSALVTASLLLSSVTPSLASASENTDPIVVEKEQQVSSQSKLISVVEPYVKVTEEGTLTFENVPSLIYAKYNLAQLQNHIR